MKMIARISLAEGSYPTSRVCPFECDSSGGDGRFVVAEGAGGEGEEGEDDEGAAENQNADAPGRGADGDGVESDVQIGPRVHHDGAGEGQHAALLGDVRADGGGTADGGVLLLDEALGEAHEGGILVGAVALNDVLRVLLG